MTIMRVGGRRDDLLAQHGAALALDRAQLRIELVGAVDGQIEPCQRVEGKHRQARRFRGAAGGERRGDGRHLQARRDPFPERGDGEVRRRAGAKADQHSVLDLGDGGTSRRAFARRDIVLVGGLVATSAAPFRAVDGPRSSAWLLASCAVIPASRRGRFRSRTFSTDLRWYAVMGHFVLDRLGRFRRWVSRHVHLTPRVARGSRQMIKARLIARAHLTPLTARAAIEDGWLLLTILLDKR